MAGLVVTEVVGYRALTAGCTATHTTVSAGSAVAVN